MKKVPAASSPAYTNPALPAEKHGKDMFTLMTFEERAAQRMRMSQEPRQKLVDEWDKFERSYS